MLAMIAIPALCAAAALGLYLWTLGRIDDDGE